MRRNTELPCGRPAPVYDAFISYSYVSDAKTVPVLRASIEGFGLPLFRARSFRIWHDRASLAMTDALWQEIAHALDLSRTLIVIMSPASSRSPWVDREVEHFLANNSRSRVGLVLSTGRTPWTDAEPRTDGREILQADDCAVSEKLFDLFTRDGDEPKLLDLRPYRQPGGGLNKRAQGFDDLVASIAAMISGRPKDELYGAHIRRLRWRMALLSVAIVIFFVLFVVVALFWQRAVLETQIESAGRATALSVRPGREREALQASIPPAAWALGNGSVPAQVTEGIVAALGAELRSRELSGHSGEVVMGVFAPDGRTILTASTDRSARVWAAADGHLQATLRQQAAIRSAAFAHGGQLAATGAADGTITLWDVTTWLPRSSFLCSCGSVRSIGFSPDDTELVVASDAGQMTSWTMDGRSGRLRLHGQYFDYSAKGARIATASSAPGGNGIVVVWDARSQMPISRRTFEEEVHSVAFHPSNEDLVLVAWGRFAGIWNARSGDLQKLSHPELVEQARFSRDGTRIVTVSSTMARLWGVDGTINSVLEGHTRYVTSGAFSPDAQQVLTTSGDGTARIWSLYATDAVTRFGPGGGRLRWAEANGEAIVSLDYDGRVVQWAAATGRRNQLADHTVGVSFDARRVTLIAVDVDGAVAGYELSSGHRLMLGKGTDRKLRRAVFSPDALRYIGIRSDGTAFLGQSNSGSQPQELDNGPSGIQDAVFCSGGTRIVTASGGSVAVADAVRGNLIVRFPLQSSPTFAIACTRDASRVFASYSDLRGPARTVLWGLDSTREVATLIAGGPPVKAAAFSPDGKRVVLGNILGELFVFETRSGWRVAALSPQTQAITHIAYAANGERFLSSSTDGTVRVWDSRSNLPVATLRVAQEEALYAEFTRDDGEELVAGDGRGWVSVYHLGLRGLIARGCERLRGSAAYEEVIQECGHF